MTDYRQIAPGVEVEAIAYPASNAFDFSQIQPGESFMVRAGNGKTARQNRDRVLGWATAWLMQNDCEAHFRSGEREQDGSYRIYMIAGKRAYPAKHVEGDWG
ncbi:hypothetical protein [Cohaesibacter gelatinilyticus]|uniref:Uncharacterized protein n=1 Tax=Cohaesibacter gelatinilyticus TaxID=372072 RepID=A0A285PCE5_9HYPH|nr:hypothetical protein [Cohaesibacter gelatinilyticus]SNZ19402.1 hypothetical protein SAMN06265368_2487 [Cohaesibacter gelatinilyticus]